MNGVDDNERRGPMTPFEWWFSALFLAGMLSAFAAIIVVDYEPAKLVPLFVVVFWLVLLPIHEFAHALAAWMAGWRVCHVVIGMGSTWHRFRLGGAEVELRLFPVEGFCGYVPTNLRWPRLKNALIAFAGPGSELLLLAGSVAVVGVAPLLQRSESVGIIAAQSLAVTVLASAFFNLVPHYIVSGRGLIPNDGLAIVQSFSKPASHFAGLMGSRDPWERDESEDDG